MNDTEMDELLRTGQNVADDSERVQRVLLGKAIRGDIERSAWLGWCQNSARLFDKRHRTILEAIRLADAKASRLDQVLVAQELMLMGKLHQTGGLTYLLRIMDEGRPPCRVLPFPAANESGALAQHPRPDSEKTEL